MHFWLPASLSLPAENMLKKSILILGSCVLVIGGTACSKRHSPPPPEIPGLYVENVSVKESENLAFVVRLSPTRDGEVSVDYTIQAPADRGAEYQATLGVDVSGAFSGRVVIPAGVSEVTLSIPVNGDDVFERDEVLALSLSNPSGADIQLGKAIGTIVNDDSAPVVSFVADPGDVATVTEQSGESRNFKVRIEGKTALPVSFSLSFNDEYATTGIATYYADFVVKEGSQRHIRYAPVVVAADPALPVSREIDYSLEVVNDGALEIDERIKVTATNSVNYVDVKFGSLIELAWKISANDNVPAITTRALNDTGIKVRATGVDAPTVGKQDSELGLDSLVADDKKGFKFVKLDVNGIPLADQSLTYETTPWACVSDLNTGLVWEMRQGNNIGIHQASLTATYFDPDPATNGGDEGKRGENEDCRADSFFAKCNTATIVAETNLERLCNMTGWRLPTIEELRSIVDYSVKASASGGVNAAAATFFYDMNYFTGQYKLPLWTSTSFKPSNNTKATQVKTINLYSHYDEEPLDKNADGGLLLVNDRLR